MAAHATGMPAHETQPVPPQRGLLVICDTTVFRDEEHNLHHQHHPDDHATSKGRQLCIQGHAHVWIPTGTMAEDEATHTTIPTPRETTQRF